MSKYDRTLVRAVRKWVFGLVTAACGVTALGQETQGALSGHAPGGVTVVLMHLASGQTRTLTADGQGRFLVSRLQPGDYRVTGAGRIEEVTVEVGRTSVVELGPKSLGTVLVEGHRQGGLVDVRSAESPTIFTSEQVEQLPVARDVAAVAQLAPGVNDSKRTALTVISGASAAENAFYINGLDVTDLRSMTSFAPLPFQAIGQQQVKSGGYGAEYGRSLGGVVSLNTKRGTNEWKAGAAVNMASSAWSAKPRDILDLNPDTASPVSKKPAYALFASGNSSKTETYDFYAGGPLIKDRLFLFGVFSGTTSRSEAFSSISSSTTVSKRPTSLIKIDYAPGERHALEFTLIDARSHSTADTFSNSQRAGASADTPVRQLLDDRWYATQHFGDSTASTTDSRTKVMIGKYTGIVTDNLSWSLLVGRVANQQPKTTAGIDPAPDCPYVVGASPAIPIGCWITGSSTLVRDPNQPGRDWDTRKSFRMDAEYSFGNHLIRAGFDATRFTARTAGQTYVSGGSRWIYYNSGTGSLPNLVPPGQQYVQESYFSTSSGAYQVRNAAAYVEDSWQILPQWLIYAGIRSEQFNNLNGDGRSFIHASGQLAPRFGMVWDILGNSTTRLFANAGRYFIPLPANVNIVQSSTTTRYDAYYRFTGKDPRTAAPTGLSDPIAATGTRTPAARDPATLSDTHIRPMSQDELSLGIQQAAGALWRYGVLARWRRINDGMDDYCGAYAQKQWAINNGYTKYFAGSSPSCIIINPGRDVHIKLDLNNDGNLKEVTIPASYLNMPVYSRSFRALEFTLERKFTSQGSLGASYVWSQLKGTSEGYVPSDYGGSAAGSQAFDFGSMMQGSDGPLPNDRRHVLKIFGNFRPDKWLNLGFYTAAQSGTPTSCHGFVPRDAPDFAKVDDHRGAGDSGAPSSYYCLGDDKKTRLTTRGSQGRLPWTYTSNVLIAGTFGGATGNFTLQLLVNNVFNSQQVILIREIRDFSRANSNLQYSNDPATQASVRFNANYRQPVAFQAPRSIQVSLRYDY